LHLHGLEDRHRLAGTHEVVLGDVDRADGGLERGGDGGGALEGLHRAGLGGGRGGGAFEGARLEGGGRVDQAGGVVLDEGGGGLAGGDGRFGEEGAQQRGVGVEALDAEFGQRAGGAGGG